MNESMNQSINQSNQMLGIDRYSSSSRLNGSNVDDLREDWPVRIRDFRQKRAHCVQPRKFVWARSIVRVPELEAADRWAKNLQGSACRVPVQNGTGPAVLAAVSWSNANEVTPWPAVINVHDSSRRMDLEDMQAEPAHRIGSGSTSAAASSGPTTTMTE